MPDAGNYNIDIAHHLGEARKHEASGHETREHETREHEARKHIVSFAEQAIEIAEALILAIVAVATAWSGYQAARWTGYQAERYGEANRLRVEAEGAETAANQERLLIAATVSEWLKAEAQGQHKIAKIFERRIFPDYRPVFEAWKKTDPINNPNAPAGPQVMNLYQGSKAAEAVRLNRDASNLFEQGNQARDRSDDYVRTTVMLATILLLIAISQRFKIQFVRVAVLVFAALLLCYPLYFILQLPRA